MLAVECSQVRPEGEADQGAAGAPEHVQGVRAARPVAAPERLGDDADPGRDDRGEPDVRRVQERVERTGTDFTCEPEEAVDRKGGEHLAGERGQHDHAHARDRERGESDDRKADQGGEPGPVGNHAAREEQPHLPLRNGVRSRGEVRQTDPARPARDRDRPCGRGQGGDAGGTPAEPVLGVHGETIRLPRVRIESRRDDGAVCATGSGFVWGACGGQPARYAGKPCGSGCFRSSSAPRGSLRSRGCGAGCRTTAGCRRRWAARSGSRCCRAELLAALWAAARLGAP